ncbi:hypothetical protein LCGC14_1359460 [marine sediment metagenome]|uniref:Uncharacterized protein n=1 Tax=marine sediment metagenome TaxID=412755 RepID=A0A0F9MNW7_9ZZZZ
MARPTSAILAKKYPVLCAWCSAKGIRKVVGYSGVENSHGICENCLGIWNQQEKEDGG